MPSIWEYILNFIYPLSCEICGRDLAADNSRRLCNSCWERMAMIDIPYCPRPDIGNKVYFRRVQAVGKYEGVLKECIHLVKYNRKTALNKVLSELMIKHIKEHLNIETIDYIIPVPLYKKQYWRRGFNQTELLVSEIGRYFNKPVIAKNLKRIKNTRPQYKLNKSERIKNIKKVFAVIKPETFHQKSVLLVDDVYTTGATVNECAKVLSKAGANSVDVLVLAHGS